MVDLLLAIDMGIVADNASLAQVKIGSEKTDNLAFNAKEKPSPLTLDVENSLGGVSALQQNEPNPFKDETTIRFYLAHPGSATLIVYDVSGRQIYQIEQDYESGDNRITLTKEDFQQVK